MMFPLNLWDTSLLFATLAIILLITSELLLSYHSKVSILINKKRLRNTATAVSILFLITVAIRIVDIILNR